ncbi:glycosyltransferase family 2 protein [Flavobacterium aquatile]|uniref:Beta-lactamase regulatory protein n=1 Tax=Flavobacterium aquatile LMG 4008 = ATCC 11947 TaxID=1453498 RepID=A0A095SRT3_9FLAO|nr:glycosyltransferase [Flavobacterium aquatile]KGD67312.1 beta-lactamase regulatory protein [Flavobacterium aquatile LMG 4008 = ATCC 11947]OXA66536.1 glycosyl transferase [Flavobacterium aquatile] [Flavobacterium aquatile LMG 4008 = ATCC 11947]GEC78512.1 glycosyl transferase [Flavobacterium aquatile]
MIEIILFVVLGIYVVFILQLIFGFDKVKSLVRTDEKPRTKFSIIVPFRNEEKNLPKLLRSISNLNYPKDLFEIIMVDDFSTDASERVYIKWRMENGLIETTLLENLRLSNSPKKDAISRAIPILKHEWVVTTDADCIVNKNWLLTLDNFIQKNNAEMVVGAVVYKTKNNWFHQFQQLDLLSLQGTTIGSFGIGKPFMCNGANFAYTKKLFNEIGGFGGNNKMASGDDVFLLQKALKNHAEKVHYLKNTDTIVKTKPENDLYKLFMQRVRWASKTTGYSGYYSKSLAVVVLAMNLSLVIGLYLLISNSLNWKTLLIVFSVKYFVDYLLLLKSNQYLRKGKFIFPLASSLVYPFFCSLVGIYSLFGSFTWKGRSFKK